MATRKLIVCDACGKEKSIEESTGNLWLVVQSAASPNEYQDALLKLQEGAEMADIVDAGDFCSLMCVANWASARSNLRALDVEE